MKKKTSKRVIVKLLKTSQPKLLTKLSTESQDIKKTGVKIPVSKPTKSKQRAIKAVMPNHSTQQSTLTKSGVHTAVESEKEPKQHIPKPPKQTREQKVWKNQARMSEAKLNLQNAVNREIQEERAKGNVVEVTPQIITMLSTSKFSTKVVEKMEKLFRDKDALREYLYIHDIEGNVTSGEKAVKRYAQFASSGISKVPEKTDIILSNFLERTAIMLEKAQNVQDIQAFFNQLYDGNTSVIPDSKWYGEYNRTKHLTECYKSQIMQNNHDNLSTVSWYLNQWIEVIGEDRATRYIEEHAEEINDLFITAAIGYKERGRHAMNSLCKIFSADTADRILSMSMDNIESGLDYDGSDFQDEG